MEIIKTIGLCKVYGTGDTQVEAIKDVNITINKGEFVAVVGPSGSGKSTLLHLLGGVDVPTSGKVLAEGQDIFAMDEKNLALFRRRRAGFIFQYYNLIPVLTVEENIALPLLMDNKTISPGYIEGLMDLLALTDRRHHLPSQLSGGQQQRVSIGRALAYKPSVILADEPTGNLDTKNGREVIDLLKLCIKKYDSTLVMITHDLNIASQADRVIQIEDGRICS